MKRPKKPTGPLGFTLAESISLSRNAIFALIFRSISVAKGSGSRKPRTCCTAIPLFRAALAPVQSIEIVTFHAGIIADRTGAEANPVGGHGLEINRRAHFTRTTYKVAVSERSEPSTTGLTRRRILDAGTIRAVVSKCNGLAWRTMPQAAPA